jgi:hypothetical protein
MNDFIGGVAKGASGCLGFALMGFGLLFALLVWSQISAGNRYASGRVDALDAELYCGTALIRLRETGYTPLSLEASAVRAGGQAATFTCAVRRVEDRRALVLIAERLCDATPYECTGIVEIRDPQINEAIWTRP